MNNPTYSSKTNARIAGVLYLLMGITGMVGILYVPSQILVAGDAAATAANVQAKEMLFRLGILSQLACQIVFVYLVLSLYRLFKDVHLGYARQMLALVLVAVPIAFLNLLNQIAALILLGDDAYLQTFGTNELNAMALFFLQLYEQGVNIVQFFWGLWLFPFGILAYRSGFIPRIFGVLLIVGGAGYVVASFTSLVFPAYGQIVGPIATMPSGVAEIAVIFWMLIKGTRTKVKSGKLLERSNE